MGPRRQLGLSITFVDDDAVMRVPGIVEKEPSPTVAVVTPPSVSSFKSNSLVVALKSLSSTESMTNRVRQPSARLQRFMPRRVIRGERNWTRKKVMPNQAQMNSPRQHQERY